jgi:YidC/Oxa1 family membrane protein insertase
MKDKKTIIGILLIVVIMVGWGIWMQPSKAEREKAQAQKKHILDSTNKANLEKRISDSLELVKANAPDSSLFKDSVILKLPDSLQQAAIDSIQMAKKQDSLGAFAAHGIGKEDLITVETEKFLLTFNTRGGLLYRNQMLGYQSYTSRFVDKKNDTLDLWIPGQTAYGVSLLTEKERIETAQLYFATDAKSNQLKVKGNEELRLSFKIFANNDPKKYLEYVYTITGNDNMIGFDINLVGLDKIVEQNIGELPFTWLMITPSQEHEISKERENSNIWYSSMEGDVSQLKGGTKSKPKKGEVKYPLKWVSFKQQFFSTALIPANGFTSSLYTLGITPGATDKENKIMAAELAVPFASTPNESFKMRMYMGPNHWNTLKKYDLGLQKQIDLGYVGFLNRWLVIPVFNFFAGLKWNYGLIILMLTLIIKLITMPLIYKTFVSSAKMRLLKPDIDALGEKFKPEEALAKQQAVMALYKRAGVSPLSGCIPALLQMPILFAMIAFFPAAFELRQEGLLWANDLSTYDSILKLPFKIPAYGDHVSLFALLMTITTIFYTKMNSGQMAAQGGIQAQQMKIMMYLMPVVFLIFLNSYSAALSYYYFLSNLISILIMLFIRKFMIDEKKLHAQIEENKKKTPKKSKWMSRMEDIQKARTEQMRQQQNKGKKK